MSDDADTFLPGRMVTKKFGVSNATLVKWANDGKVSCRRMPGGKRLYSKRDVWAQFGGSGEGEVEEAEEKRVGICYARVSSAHQKKDLERQVADLRAAYPSYEVLTDVGSGLNYKRKGFLALLGRVHEGSVDTVVVRHKDRLCRYGSELVEWVFKQAGAKLVVHGAGQADADERDERTELADDLLAVVNFFVARNNGRRSAEHRRERKRAREGAAEGEGSQGEDASGSEDEGGSGRGRKKAKSGGGGSAAASSQAGSSDQGGGRAAQAEAGVRPGQAPRCADDQVPAAAQPAAAGTSA